MSPGLSEMWTQGYSVSPQWEGELELDSDDDNENGLSSTVLLGEA